MSGEKIIYLVRHGAVDIKWQGRYIGAMDVPLSKAGLAETAKLAARFRLQLAGVEHIWVSPLQRCRQSLVQLDLPGESVLIDALREINFGLYEGSTFAEISARDPALVKKWAAGGSDLVFPDGESLAAFYQRIENLYERLLQAEFKSILLVTHGGVIRHLVLKILGISYRHSLAFEVDQASLSAICLHGELGTLRFLNHKGVE